MTLVSRSKDKAFCGTGDQLCHSQVHLLFLFLFLFSIVGFFSLSFFVGQRSIDRGKKNKRKNHKNGSKLISMEEQSGLFSDGGFPAFPLPSVPSQGGVRL